MDIFIYTSQNFWACHYCGKRVMTGEIHQCGDSCYNVLPNDTSVDNATAPSLGDTLKHLVTVLEQLVTILKVKKMY